MNPKTHSLFNHMAQKLSQRTRSPIVNEDQKIGRNRPCYCGSGRKYKKCCLILEREVDRMEKESVDSDELGIHEFLPDVDFDVDEKTEMNHNERNISND